MEEIFVMGLCCLPVGIFIAVIIFSGVQKVWVRILCTIIFGAFISLFFGWMFHMEYQIDRDTWNDGRCPCGGSYEFVNANRYRNHTTYYWECDTCKSIIETEANMRG